MIHIFFPHESLSHPSVKCRQIFCLDFIEGCNELLCFSWSTIWYISLSTHDLEESLLFCFKAGIFDLILLVEWFLYPIFDRLFFIITGSQHSSMLFVPPDVGSVPLTRPVLPQQLDDDTDMFNTAKVWVFFKSLILIMFIIFVNSCEASDCPSTPLGNDSQTATFSDQILVFL